MQDDKIYYTEIGNAFWSRKPYFEEVNIFPEKFIDAGYATLETKIDKDGRRYGQLVIREHYCIDGGTGALDTKDALRGFFVHDVLCDMINDGFLKRCWQEAADGELHEINLEDDVPEIRADWIHAAVRFYERSGLKKFKPKEILTAP